MLVVFKASDRPRSKTFYALVALKIMFLNSPSARCETESLNATRAGLEKPGGGGTGTPGPRNFISWEGPRGTRYFYKWALLTGIVMFFRQFAIFAYTLWGPFGAWGPFP